MKINITQEDIDNGRIGDCILCPIALKLKQVTGVIWEVYWNSAFNTATTATIDLPEDATDFISMFDQQEKVMPFTFEFPWRSDEKITSIT